MKTTEKEKKLENILNKARKVIVAFSGGVDSTYLLKKSLDILGKENVLAVTAKSEVVPKEDYQSAIGIAKKLGANHKIIRTNELNNPLFACNSAKRCYHCKKSLLKKLRAIGGRQGISFIADGTNYSDRNDYRPGANAVAELGACSPLKEARLTKEEIRELSRKKGLETWDKTASPCLASRIPYGTPITLEVLSAIEQAEKVIRSFGVKNVRVRHEAHTARIEVDASDMQVIFEKKEEISKKLKSLGYYFVALDLSGYAQGSLNKEMVAS